MRKKADRNTLLKLPLDMRTGSDDMTPAWLTVVFSHWRVRYAVCISIVAFSL